MDNSLSEDLSLKTISIGGWLLLFCIGLTILGPIYTIGQINISWHQTQAVFESYPSIRTVITWEIVGQVFITLYGFVVGVLIWSKSERGKIIAQQYLKIRIVTIIVVELVALMLMSGLPSQMQNAAYESLFGTGIREGGYFLIWYFYFEKSKRIMKTYTIN